MLLSPETIFILDAIDWFKYLIGFFFFVLGLFSGWWQWHYRTLLARLNARAPVDPVIAGRPLAQEDPAPEEPATTGQAGGGAPEEADNLEMIRGIGRSLKLELNRLGVYQFRQIASWEADEVAAMAQKLNLAQQIDRLHWVEQAKQLERIHGGGGGHPELQGSINYSKS